MKVSLMMIVKNEIVGMKLICPRIKNEWLHEVVMCDGGSTDGSIEYAESLGYRVVRQKPLVKKKIGHGDVLTDGIRQGIEACTGDYILMFTPDNNMIPEKIPEIIAKAKEGYDMVVCSRYADGAKSADDTLLSGFGNWMFTTMVNVLFGAKYTDVLGFYRIYRKDLLRELEIDIKLTIDTQLCIRCAIDNKKVVDIGGDEPARIGGQSSTIALKNGVQELSTIMSEFSVHLKNTFRSKFLGHAPVRTNLKKV